MNNEGWDTFRRRALELQNASKTTCRASGEEKKRLFYERSLNLRRKKGQTTEETEQLKVISFYVNGEFFGIDVKYLQEVYETEQITKIPCTPHVLAGLINYRGKVLTIVHLPILLDLQDDPKALAPDSSFKKILVVELDGVSLGLSIDKLDQLLKLSKKEIQPVSSFFRDKNKFIQSGFQMDKQPLLIIDPEALLNDERLTVVEDV